MRNLTNIVLFVLAWGTALAFPTSADAHTSGETYVWINIEENRLVGRVEINLNDLRAKLNIAVPDVNPLPVVKQHQGDILKYVRQHLEFRANGKQIPMTYGEIQQLDLSANEEGNYIQISYTTPDGKVPDVIEVKNSLFVDTDLLHRSLVCVEKNEKSGQDFDKLFVAMVFGQHNPVQELDLTNIELLLRPRDFVWQGVLHIWIGTDHILFIITLLLPAVLVYQDKKWSPVPNFKQAFWNIIRIVTIFTVAHSITLSLAALGLVKLESWIVESVIALSIILVAINTISPRFQDKTWLVIFGFGLFHGMGFASVMSDLPFRMVNLVKVLIGFNVGVELGQLAIVAGVFPVIFLLRNSRFYVPLVLRAGSAITALIACFWFVERAFGISLAG